MAGNINGAFNSYMNNPYINPYGNPYSYHPPEYPPPQYVWYPPSPYYQQQQQVMWKHYYYYLQQQQQHEQHRVEEEGEECLSRQQQQVILEQLQLLRRQREEEEVEEEEEEEEEEAGRLKQQQQGRLDYSWEIKLEEERPYSRFLSFFEYDDSFLTPWHWNPDAPPAAPSTSFRPKSNMMIEPGSYFAYGGLIELIDEENKSHSSAEASLDGVSDKNLSKIVAEPVPYDLLGQNVSETSDHVERVRDELVDHDKPSKINVDKRAPDDALDDHNDHSTIEVEEVSRISFSKRLDQINAKQAPVGSLDRSHSSTIDVEEACHSFFERLDRNTVVDPRKLRKHKRDL